jgi:hypothetical protein
MLLAVVVMAGGLLVAQAIPDRHAVLLRTGQVVRVLYTDKKRKQNFPHIKGSAVGIGCKVIYE